MKIVVFLLVFALGGALNQATNPDDDDPQSFGELFRRGLEIFRNPFSIYGDGDQKKDKMAGSGDDHDEGSPGAIVMSDFRNFCGCRLGASSRIIGGKEAAKDSIPWHVSLGTRSGIHLCGGKRFVF